MAAIVGSKFKVFMESDRGEVVEIEALAMQLDLHAEFNGLCQYELTLKGMGEPVMSHEGWNKKQRTRETVAEWQCLWCHRPNKKHDETCKSCGAVRSFIYS